MRTAVISDLHLGLISGEDVLRLPAPRRALLEEIGGADRVVLLGDVVELRVLPLGEALATAQRFFEELGEALSGREVILVAGNHDHRFAEPLLDRLSVPGGGPLELEHRYEPTAGPAAQIDEWLGDARLELAYPGLWLREDVYATHGHYMDCHLSIPRLECIAAVAMMRAARRLPDPATPADYERVLRPIYGFAFGLAQTRTGRTREPTGRPSEAAWRLLSEDHRGRGAARRLQAKAVRAGIPAAVWAMNRALRSSFKPDLSVEGISTSGIAAATEVIERLGIDAAHVLTGHTHRAGPISTERPWPLHGGGRLHNTGNWVLSKAVNPDASRRGPYWPGTVTWVEKSGPPAQVQVLSEISREELLSRATRR